MRRFLLCLPALLAFAALAPAQVPPARMAPGNPVQTAPTTDYQDLVFLGSTRPVLIRVHMLIDGRPYYAPWDDYMKKLFTYFDRNGDGVLSKEEMERAPNGQFLMNHLQGAIGLRFQGQAARMADADTNKDGKVSLDEFKAYYRRANFTALRFSSFANTTTTDTVTSAIFKHLDGEKDGKLTAERVAKAAVAFQRLDEDEDEMITQAEMAPNHFNRNFGFAPMVPGTMRAPVPLDPQGFIQINPGQPIDGVVRQVLAHYDKNKNGYLSLAECGLDWATFDSLDVNHDAQLDAAELKRFFSREPDLEFIVRAGKLVQENMIAKVLRDLGGKAMALPRTEVFNPKKRPMPLAEAVRSIDRETLNFSLGDARIELFTSPAGGFNRFQNVRQFYVQQFQILDAKKKGYIETKEGMANQFIGGIFALADRDGDGKLYEKELTGYLDMQAEGSGCYAVLQINDQGRSLFDVFDANKDGRLSVRELRTAWSRLEPLANMDGEVTRMDIPRRLSMSLGQGQAGFRGPQAMAGPAAKQGPLWFRKMDRNNDGDLSPREFLGTAEEFRMLDTDGDGLISTEEALQAEARLTKQKEKKP